MNPFITDIKTVFEKIFKLKTNNVFIQFFRYFVVSGIALIIDIIILYCLTEYFGVHYLISTLIGNVVGMAVNYILNVIWVFDKRRYNDRRLEFIIFTIIGVVGIGLNEVILWFFTEKVGLYFMNSKWISVGVGFLFRFTLRKCILFRE